MNTMPSALVLVPIPALALVVAATAVALWSRARVTQGLPGAVGRGLLWVASWMLLWGALAASGVLARFDARPPPMLFMLGGVFAAALFLGLSRVGAQVAQATPLAWLIAVQAFRLPLEIGMHQAAVEGVMPIQMSYSGFNFDIATGVTAAILAFLLYRGVAVPRSVLWAWNIMGTLLLINILVVAMLSTPLIAAFGTAPHQLNVWVTHFPYVYLPVVLVVAAAVGHIVIFRRLKGPAL